VPTTTNDFEGWGNFPDVVEGVRLSMRVCEDVEEGFDGAFASGMRDPAIGLIGEIERDREGADA